MVTPPPDACRCLASGCHRWTRRWSARSQWLCADHWRRLPRRLRLANTRFRRLDRVTCERAGPGSAEAQAVRRRWFFAALARASSRRMPREIADLL